MEKEQLLLALFSVVSFLLPIGMYCLILSSINRRPRPVMAGGGWDAVGLLFAAGGFFLVVVPMLLTEFYRRTSSAVENSHFVSLWLTHWALWIGYFTCVIVAAGAMIAWRSSKTAIYNVDLDQFSHALDHTFSVLGLDAQQKNALLVIGPAAAPSSESAEAFTASRREKPGHTSSRPATEVIVEAFPAMCHVMLHWQKVSPDTRLRIETELDKGLGSAAPIENPAAGWFLTLSGLILGAVTALALAMAFLLIPMAR